MKLLFDSSYKIKSFCAHLKSFIEIITKQNLKEEPELINIIEHFQKKRS